MEIRNAHDLKKAHPGLYKQIYDSAYNEAVLNERKRIKELEEIINPLNEAMAKEAMFVTGATAGSVAIAMYANRKR